MNYYNEFDPKAAAWLRQLIAAGLIPEGEVDERSVVDVRGADLAGFIQCHFFAGIGGWPYALQLAGWSEDEPAWTGSCPCQPFSQAGQGKGEQDKRHLWPDFRRLIEECKPARVFGEQVASKAGRRWLNGVRVNLEELAYEVGAADLCSAGCGAPHIRQRIYWMADAEDSDRGRSNGAIIDGRRTAKTGRSGVTDIRVGNSNEPGSQRRRQHDGEYADQCASGASGYACWSRFDVVHCTDGKSRRIEAGTFPLANGIPARMGRLRGYGNAITPQVAAEFVSACMDVMGMPKKKSAGPDTEAAGRIARAFVDLNLNPELPADWIVAVREAGAEYPSQQTIEAARVELIRLLCHPVQVRLRRDSHKLRRH